MNLNFHASKVYDSQVCGICIEPIKIGGVEHDGEGNKHPFHLECIKNWMYKDASCPVCRIRVNSKFLFSKMEKLFFQYNRIKRITGMDIFKLTILINILMIGYLRIGIYQLTPLVCSKLLTNCAISMGSAIYFKFGSSSMNNSRKKLLQKIFLTFAILFFAIHVLIKLSFTSQNDNFVLYIQKSNRN